MIVQISQNDIKNSHKITKLLSIALNLLATLEQNVRKKKSSKSEQKKIC